MLIIWAAVEYIKKGPLITWEEYLHIIIEMCFLCFALVITPVIVSAAFYWTDSIFFSKDSFNGLS